MRIVALPEAEFKVQTGHEHEKIPQVPKASGVPHVAADHRRGAAS